jgi:Do/DeqQ family serine protease
MGRVYLACMEVRKMKSRNTLLAVSIVFLIGASVLASAQNTAIAPASSSLQGVQSSLREVAQKVRPAVVEINVTEVVSRASPMSSPFGWFFNQDQRNGQGNDGQGTMKQSALGSGIIVRQSGSTVYVLTNNHVVENATDISVRLTDAQVFTAKVVGTDSRKDIALVSFTTPQKVAVADLGDSSALQVGDLVLAVGNPLGFESTVTMGMVSAVGRHGPQSDVASAYTDYIQTDAAINQGNSGGALVNIDGQVIGINTWIAAPSGGSVGLGFAIPINSAKTAIDQFITKGKVQYGWLGALIGNIKDDQAAAKDMKLDGVKGAFVLGMYKGSPADKAGLKPGDYVTTVGTTQIADANQLTQVIGSLPAGARTDLTVIRLGEQKTLQATIGERDAKDQVALPKNLWPGMAVLNLTDEIRQQAGIPASVHGVVVGSLADQDAPAAAAGFQPGDVVTTMNGARVGSLMDFYKALNQGKGKTTFQVVRNGTELTIVL